MAFSTRTAPKNLVCLFFAAAALVVGGCSNDDTNKSVREDIKSKTVKVPKKWRNGPDGSDPADERAKPIGGTAADGGAGSAAPAAGGAAVQDARSEAVRADADSEAAVPRKARADRTLLASWWRRFNDPVLEELLIAALHNNPDLKSMLSKVVESRARRGLEFANMMPVINGYVDGSQSYIRGHKDTYKSKGDFSNGYIHHSRSGDIYDAGLKATWEIDLFGKYRAAAAAAGAEILETEENYRLAQISLVTDIAELYVALRADEALRRVLETSAFVRAENFRLAKWRREAGTGDEYDLQTAENELEQVRAAIPVVIARIEQERNLLCTLSGKAPGFFDPVIAPISREKDAAKPVETAEEAIAGVPVAPSDIELASPAKVLAKRPDVCAARNAILAAAFQLKSARRERYPTINLSGAIGIEALKVGNLFSPDATVGSVAAGLIAPIFDGFRISTNIDIRTEAQKQALANYEKVVLDALREVEDTLVAIRETTRRLDNVKRSAAVAADNEKLAGVRYKSGTAHLGAVLDAQRVRLTATELAVAVAAEQTTAQITLYRALGGPWMGEDAAAPDPAAAPAATPPPNATAQK